MQGFQRQRTGLSLLAGCLGIATGQDWLAVLLVELALRASGRDERKRRENGLGGTKFKRLEKRKKDKVVHDKSLEYMSKWMLLKLFYFHFFLFIWYRESPA
jgi:hypothetical protein